MKILSIDIETFSSVDLKKSGVFKYVESSDFEILLIGYQYDNGPVQILDLTKMSAGADTHPDEVDIIADQIEDLARNLLDPSILKTAYNANFEITCLKKYFCPALDPSQWRCTMVRAAMIGLPFGLNHVADVLKLPVQKYNGLQLIKYFCCPVKPSKANGMRERNFSFHDPGKWNEFKEYCKIDVQVERLIDQKIDFFQPSEFEKPMFAIDQQINARGIMIDLKLVENIIAINKVYSEKLIAEAIELTGLDNPKSVSQLKKWIEEETEEEIDNLQAGNIHELIAGSDSEKVKRVLKIRQQISKSSISKYQAMLNSVCTDGRIRGLFQYYGANRTGRWAGRLVQVQNLVKNDMKMVSIIM